MMILRAAYAVNLDIASNKGGKMLAYLDHLK